jgi:hypothetical protein
MTTYVFVKVRKFVYLIDKLELIKASSFYKDTSEEWIGRLRRIVLKAEDF